MHNKLFVAAIIALALIVFVEFGTVYAQNSQAKITLIKNANNFDGKHENLSTPTFWDSNNNKKGEIE